MNRTICRVLAASIMLLFTVGNGYGSTHDFFKGKRIHLVVGFSPGGGFDIYARAIARHLGKHIPGNPSIIIQNMTGAGSLIAANHVYKVAKPDGLTIGNFIGSLFLGQVLGRPGIEFDSRKFEYIGVPAKVHHVCAMAKGSGITSMEKWRTSRMPVALGATGPGASSHDHPKILGVALGLPIRLVAGYPGQAAIQLAAARGEVAGFCGFGWDTVKATWEAIAAGDAIVVLQTRPQVHPDLPNAPLAIDFAETDEARQLIEAGIHAMGSLVRTFALPPGTPKERVQVLQTAFMDTMRAPEFLADARRSGLEIDPLTGEDMRKIIASLFKLTPKVVAGLKQVLE